MKDYLKRFKSMVDDLHAHPQCRVTRLYIGPPAEKEEIEEAEAYLERNLPKAVESFYRQCNRLQLAWTHVDDPHYDPGLHNKTQTTESEYLHEGHEFAQINIVPLREIFTEESKYQELEGDVEAEIGDNVYSIIRPFDLFSEFNDMAFLIDKESDEDLIVTAGDDYQATYEDSRLTDFESYMEMILASRGIILARRELYLIYKLRQKFIKTPRSYWNKKNIPDLDKLTGMHADES